MCAKFDFCSHCTDTRWGVNYGGARTEVRVSAYRFPRTTVGELAVGYAVHLGLVRLVTSRRVTIAFLPATTCTLTGRRGGTRTGLVLQVQKEQKKQERRRQ